MKRPEPKLRAPGFTLIELLVVIAIIAILAAILFPVFVNVKRQGQKTSCGSNMQQLYKAVLMYANDCGRLPMVCVVDGNGVANWNYNNSTYRVSSATYRGLKSYVKSDNVYICPGGRLKCDFLADGTRYEVDYRFSPSLNYSAGKPVRTKGLDECKLPKRFYVLSDRHSNHHYASNDEGMSNWVMLMVMADGHLVSDVKPYDSNYKDSKGQLKYDHWDFPNCHFFDRQVAAEYY
jgi:prepilin-type N-terminal cleavage/methylation domain-containing protein